MSETVFVGMSGGVDSSVAAKRLIERGYHVVGVFIKVWQPDFIVCEWEKERLDAMRVAAHLDIPFLTFNAEESYKKDVADYMIQAYEAGYTPNPDVMCNEHVKFGSFFNWARAQGADKIATGHYARTETKDGVTRLFRGIDGGKDQSYFLWRIPKEVLPYVLFPIGDTLKTDVRKEAEGVGIPTFAKSDSQGVCFLGDIDMKEFLSHFIQLSSGRVLNEAGSQIGTHSGALLYTIGERHGFTVETKGDSNGPKYVISRDLRENTITVGSEPLMISETDKIKLTDTRQIGSGFMPGLTAQFRYRQTPIPVKIEIADDQNAILHTAVTSSVAAPMSGQSCVLYRDDECCGGGVISYC